MAAAPRIRWDRLSRLALVFTFVALMGLYVRPALTYWHTRAQARHTAGEVSALEREHRDLRRRQTELRQPGVLAAEARRMGYVMPGERAYVLTNLPK